VPCIPTDWVSVGSNGILQQAVREFGGGRVSGPHRMLRMSGSVREAKDKAEIERSNMVSHPVSVNFAYFL